ncbi:MAG: hypothetical protein ACYTF9_09285 [Planctomycetota bacterium]
MANQQFVILSKTGEKAADGGMPPLGSRAEITAHLRRLNTMSEDPATDELLFGPGICIQLPPGIDPITQMLLTISEEEIAWQVIARLTREFDWKLLDPMTGRELNG